MLMIVTFANNKGGSAKTTTTTTVAHGTTLILENMKAANGKVLVVDTDSQAHSTLLLTGRKDYADDETLIGALMAQRLKGDVNAALKRATAVSAWHPNLHVIRASGGLDAAEESMVGQDGNVFFLQRLLKQVKNDYAAIFIDTCPKFSLLTKQALLASDQVIIPLAPQYLDADGLVSMINRVQEIRNQWERENPEVTGVAVVKFSGTVNGHNQIRDEIAQDSQIGKLYLGTVPLNAEIEYAHANQRSIFDYNSGSKSAAAYAEITQRIAQKILARV
jgi:chromosome partitioning protein